jgi:hypothetical protein
MNNKLSKINPRNTVAYFTLSISILAIFTLAIVTILTSNDDKVAMTIFNTTLPVFASWIGIVLAFYFGRENFESANRQVQNIVTNLTPQTKNQHNINEIMITPYAMTILKMTSNENEDNIKLSDLYNKLTTHKVTRLPIINSKNQIKYIVHESKINSYILNNNIDAKNISLKTFLEDNNQFNIKNNEDRKFIIVSQNISLEDAQKKLRECISCKDIFVTESGKEEEEIMGWVPDVHLLKEYKNGTV